ATIAGKYEEHVGKLQEKYGIAKEEARSQVDEFKRTIEQLKKSNNKLVQLQKSLHKKETLTGKTVSDRFATKMRKRSKSWSKRIRH
ncbi:MAG TPA: hypothetical protein VGB89_13025, partial [Bacteroidota bacterium]